MPWGGGLNTNKYTTSSHGTIGLNLGWSYTQDIATNSTTISWILTSNGTMSSGYYVQAGPVTVVIGGKTVYSQTARFNMRGDGGFRKTGTVVIMHNEDGNKSVSMSVKAAIYSASVNCTGSKTFTLEKIDRYALLGTVEDFTDEGNPTITYSNPAGTDLVDGVKVRITWNSGADYTEWFDLDDAGADSPYTFDLDDYRDDLRDACANSNTLAVQFDLQSTLNNTEYHHYKNAVMSIVNANPVIEEGTITYADTSSVATITGNPSIIVRNKSTLTINVDPDNGNVEPQKSATIGNLGTSAYKLNFNGTDYTPDASGDVVITTPDVTGDIPAILTVTDSRGNTSSLMLNITVYDWHVPSATYTLERVNGFEDETILHVNADYSSVNSINVITIKEQYRRKGTSTWLPATPESVPDDTDFRINSPSGLDKQYEWEIKITVTDLFHAPSVEEYYDVVAKGVPLFYPDFKRGSIGMNGFPDEDGQFKCVGTIKTVPNNTDAGVKLPHKYSDTEHIIGYWLDDSPVYERVFDVSATIPNNTWTNVIEWNDNIQIVNTRALSATAGTCFTCVSAQYDANDSRIKVLNTRGTNITIDRLILQYYYL